MRTHCATPLWAVWGLSGLPAPPPITIRGLLAAGSAEPAVRTHCATPLWAVWGLGGGLPQMSVPPIHIAHCPLCHLAQATSSHLQSSGQGAHSTVGRIADCTFGYRVVERPGCTCGSGKLHDVILVKRLIVLHSTFVLLKPSSHLLHHGTLQCVVVLDRVTSHCFDEHAEVPLCSLWQEGVQVSPELLALEEQLTQLVLHMCRCLGRLCHPSCVQTHSVYQYLWCGGWRCMMCP